MPVAIRISNSSPRVNPADLAELEQHLGQPLPQDYRKFLEINNGGEPYNNTFDVRNQGTGKTLYSFVIRRFLAVNPRSGEDVLRTLRNVAGKLPEGYVPIAYDHFRNLMCLRLPTGEVHLYDAENAAKAEKAGQQAPLMLIAPNLEEMLHDLYHKRFS